MKNLVARFAKDESGATAIEYGLIAALISNQKRRASPFRFLSREDVLGHSGPDPELFA